MNADANLDYVKRYFDQVAAFYDAVHYPDEAEGKPARGPRALALLREQIDAMPLRPILDLGCGTGRAMTLLTGMGYPVHGLDLSSAMVEIAQKALAAMGAEDDASVEQGEAWNLFHHEDGFFGAVIALEVFEYLSADAFRDTLFEIRRVLGPGGKLIASFPNRLHHLFGLDRRSIDFIANDLFDAVPFPDADAQASVELALRGLIECPDEPVEDFPESGAYQALKKAGRTALVEHDLPRRFFNNLAPIEDLAEAGFVTETTRYYGFWPFPPVLANAYPRLLKDLAPEMEARLADDWRGLFLADYFLSVFRIEDQAR